MRVRMLAVLPLLMLVASMLFALMLVAAARPAGAGGGGHSLCAGFARGAAISIQDNCFQGTTQIVEPGSTVTVTNRGQVPHDFTAADGSFASGVLQPGATFELTVDRGGAIPFYCTIHGSATGSGMAGVIVVEQSTSANRASQVAQARTNTALPGNGAANNSPAATTTANDSAPAYLAAGALLISCLTLVFAVALVRAPRREQRAARQS